jgi:hypothetical protein
MEFTRKLRHMSFATLLVALVLAPSAVLKANPLGLTCNSWCDYKHGTGPLPACGSSHPQGLLYVVSCENSEEDFYSVALSYCNGPENIQSYNVYLGPPGIENAEVSCIDWWW